MIPKMEQPRIVDYIANYKCLFIVEVYLLFLKKNPKSEMLGNLLNLHAMLFVVCCFFFQNNFSKKLFL